MAGRKYNRLAIEFFGRQLITSGDLDPVYIALFNMQQREDMNQDQLCRWLVAYWCFYHCGFASYASQYPGDDFWSVMFKAALNEEPSPLGGRWPRSSERRHARGQQGFNMVHNLKHRYGKHPERMVKNLYNDQNSTVPIPYTTIADRVSTHTLFGPWISFKVCDMIDRVLGINVDFTEAAVFMFKDPVKAALMVWRKKQDLPDNAEPRDSQAAIHMVVEYLSETFKDLSAPPLSDRPIGLQEIETVLCKWKSHMNGHYPLLNDIDEIREGLVGWGKTAEQFGDAMPKGS